MSDRVTPPVPPGWYPDPGVPGRGRYWNGTAWTENYHTPGQPPPGLAAPAGTQPYTPWIWAFVFAPFLGYLMFVFFPWGDVVRLAAAPTSSATAYGVFGGLVAFYAVAFGLTLLLYVALVVFAYLDHRELVARGVPKPFDWPWAFIPSYGLLVYAIGRTVVVRNRLGGGALGPIWVLVAQFVAGMVLSFVVVFGVVLAAAPT